MARHIGLLLLSSHRPSTVAMSRTPADVRRRRGRQQQTWRRTFQEDLERVDYCNSVLVGAPKSISDKLQRVLNAAVRIVTGTRKFDRKRN